MEQKHVVSYKQVIRDLVDGKDVVSRCAACVNMNRVVFSLPGFIWVGDLPPQACSSLG